MSSAHFSTLLSGLICWAVWNLQVVHAVPGRVGCFYDLKLCERNELCFNDSLFGTCVSDVSDAVNYSDLEPEALAEAAKILQYLIETGYKWQDSYTQCVVGKFLQSVVVGEPYDAEVCEYLKALLEVIDRSRDQPAAEVNMLPPASVPRASEVVSSPLVNPAQSRGGEFMSLSDMVTDFGAAPEQHELPPTQIDVNDPNAYEALQQYLHAYQQALIDAADASNAKVEKKSGPTDFAATTAALSAETATVAAVSEPLNQSSDNSNVGANDTDANIQALLSLISNDPQYNSQITEVAEVMPQSAWQVSGPFDDVNQMPDSLFVPQQQPYQMAFENPPVTPDMLQQIIRVRLLQEQVRQQEELQRRLQNPWNSLDFNDQNGLQFTPDIMQTQGPIFSRSNRAMDLSPMNQIALSQQMYGPPPLQYQMPMQPDFYPFGPQQQQMMPDQMMMIDPAPIDPRVLDILMAQRAQQQQQMNQFLQPSPMMQQVDPRALFGADPNGMNYPAMGPQIYPDQFSGMPMKRGFFPPMQGNPYMDQNVMMYPYGIFPQEVALPFGQQAWSPPLVLPAGFSPVDAGYPMVMATSNDTMDLFDEMRGESQRQQTPSSPNKKDQEYGTLLRTGDNTESGADEDVTVQIVTRQPTDVTVKSTDVDESATNDDENNKYVFMITAPAMNLEDARLLVNWLASMMDLPTETFYDISVKNDLTTFRVNPALEKLNATYIAQTLGDEALRQGLRENSRLVILRVGVGQYALEDSADAESPMRFQQIAVVQPETALAPQAQQKTTSPPDPSVVFMVTNPALSYDVARRIMNWLALALDIPQTVFTNLHIVGNQLQFRVSPYFNPINASTVVSQLSKPELRAGLLDQFGVEIMRAGLGDDVQVVPAAVSQRQSLLIALIAIACAAALLISVSIILLVRRNLLMRRKLDGLGGDIESSKEYEELCRQRMASKNVEAGGSPERVPHSAHSSTSSWSEEPAPSNMDITTGHMILSYMEDHLKNENRLNEEWNSLCTYEADPAKKEAGSKTENLNKNRYPDILPYDHSRVMLNADVHESKSDYINASYIIDADPKNPAYIATQGPLPETVVDFWQMVWEKNTAIIVNLTKLKENDQDLCHVYWPKEGVEVYGNFEVNLVSEHAWCDDYLVRSFYLKSMKSHETRTVTQFHYMNWPHLGVPSSLKTFLEFRRKINKCYKCGSSPIVVHCSDGVDRTGAYCLIDLVLNRMAKGAKEIDIAATLEHLRDQRMDMVRTKEQFEFVLTAVAQEIQAILKSMPQK